MVTRALVLSGLATLGLVSGCFITADTYNGWFYDTAGWDSGSYSYDGYDGTDGNRGPTYVSGAHQVYFPGVYGVWEISGNTNPDCGSCLFEFFGDFRVRSDSDIGQDFSATVTWTTDFYVYGFNGDYWGYGWTDGYGHGYWAGYSTNGNYYYYGYVSD